MLYRKISTDIEAHLRSGSDKIMVVEGARQIGKSYIIREVGNRLYKNFVEINFAKDDETEGLFRDIRGLGEFYITLSMVAGGKLGDKTDTLVFLDEIQHYPQYLTMLKFLREEGKFTYIASGSMLGIALRNTASIPVGSIIRKQMYQLDFEEWLIAEGWGKEALGHVRDCYKRRVSLSEAQHANLLGEFKKYLLVGGMPDAVNTYLETHNIVRVREVQESIRNLYKEDASKYEKESGKKLLVRRIYDMIVSQMENKKKRIVAKDIRDKKGDRFEWFAEEFEYLISSGIALDVHAISNPKYPLSESVDAEVEDYEIPAELPAPALPRMATLYIGKGKKDKISKGDIVGFLCKKGGLTTTEIGKIDVKERYAYVAVARPRLRQVLRQVAGEKIKGIRTVVEEVR